MLLLRRSSGYTQPCILLHLRIIALFGDEIGAGNRMAIKERCSRRRPLNSISDVNHSPVSIRVNQATEGCEFY